MGIVLPGGRDYTQPRGLEPMQGTPQCHHVVGAYAYLSPKLAQRNEGYFLARQIRGQEKRVCVARVIRERNSKSSRTAALLQKISDPVGRRARNTSRGFPWCNGGHHVGMLVT